MKIGFEIQNGGAQEYNLKPDIESSVVSLVRALHKMTEK
jgi:hypothetical protein